MTTVQRMKRMVTPALATALLTVALTMPFAFAPLAPDLINDDPIGDLFEVGSISITLHPDGDDSVLRLTEPQIFRM